MRLEQKILRDINTIIIDNIYLDNDVIEKNILEYIEQKNDEIEACEYDIDLEVIYQGDKITLYVFGYGSDYYCLKSEIIKID